jgi:putative transcriptional regulator
LDVNGSGLETRVRQVRRERRMTQAELATAVGVSRQTIISIEGGDYTPSVLLALRLAGALGSTVETLFYLSPQEA